MEIKFLPIEKDFLYSHLLFIALCILVLIIPFPNLIGVKLFILVLSYNLLILVVGVIRNHTNWLKLYYFVLFISIFQIFPDWYLSAQLDILVFPEDGFFKIGTVSAYMLGLWVIPLFIIGFISLRIKERYSIKSAYLSAILLSLIIFGLAEQSMWVFSWYPQNVFLLFDHLAVYIIIPEIILGLSTFYLFLKFMDTKISYKIVLAFVIMLLYLGAANFFYFLIEEILLFSL
ncbi:MAG: hypothetical protein EU552_01085 [Promethearchaeota archaeon]|nr:MAG: hypothetical protein EU552_01085 [Candidatus Lokiarchaeota archaeon]